MWLFNERRDTLQNGMVNSMQVRAPLALVSVRASPADLDVVAAAAAPSLFSTSTKIQKCGTVSRLCCGVSRLPLGPVALELTALSAHHQTISRAAMVPTVSLFFCCTTLSLSHTHYTHTMLQNDFNRAHKGRRLFRFPRSIRNHMAARVPGAAAVRVAQSVSSVHHTSTLCTRSFASTSARPAPPKKGECTADERRALPPRVLTMTMSTQLQPVAKVP